MLGFSTNSSRRPSSITTRIKTLISAFFKNAHIIVGDHLPLQQGLRHSQRTQGLHSRVGDHLPLQQGLRPRNNFTNFNTSANVGDHLPLQQGLRLRQCCLLSARLFRVGDHLPLQQGLRLRKFIIFVLSVGDHLPLQQGLRPHASTPSRKA